MDQVFACDDFEQVRSWYKCADYSTVNMVCVHVHGICVDTYMYMSVCLCHDRAYDRIW